MVTKRFRILAVVGKSCSPKSVSYEQVWGLLVWGVTLNALLFYILLASETSKSWYTTEALESLCSIFNAT